MQMCFIYRLAGIRVVLSLFGVFAVHAEYSPDALAQNLLMNPSLESPGLPSAIDYMYLDTQPTFIPGWTVAYDGIPEPSYYLRDGHSSGGGTIIHAADGQYLIALSDGDSLSTTFNTIAGKQYSLTYYGAQPDTLQITVGDLNRLEQTTDGILTTRAFDNNGYFYSLYQVNFSAMSAMTTLTLYNVENNTQFGNFGLDGFSVVAVPESGSLAFFAFTGVILLTRRRYA